MTKFTAPNAATAAKPADKPAVAALAPARLAPVLSALLLGAFVIAGAGFASVPALHNAAHDQRHSIGFPCH